mmetsp:Transcript_43419/g.80904  ORF Transcript_43419/g.80904 Transcript_43419/m.80904 type:complete len:578 (+) Transcript_43419:73-1806(+)
MPFITALCLLASAPLVWGYRDSVQPTKRQELGLPGDIQLQVTISFCGECTLFGADFRELWVTVTDKKSADGQEWGFLFPVQGLTTDVTNGQKSFSKVLRGVSPDAELEATVDVKQRYAWKFMGMASCGSKTAKINFPHDPNVHIEPFHKEPSEEFYQLVQLVFLKETEAPALGEKVQNLNDVDSSHVQAREEAVVFEDEIPEGPTVSEVPENMSTTEEIDVDHDDNEDQEDDEAVQDDEDDNPDQDTEDEEPSSGLEPPEADKDAEEPVKPESVSKLPVDEGVFDDDKDPESPDNQNAAKQCKMCIFRLGLGLEGLLAEQMEVVADALCQCTDCSPTCEDDYKGAPLGCAKEKWTDQFQAFLGKAEKVVELVAKVKEIAPPEETSKTQAAVAAAESVSKEQDSRPPEDSAVMLATQVCRGDKAVFKKKELEAWKPPSPPKYRGRGSAKTGNKRKGGKGRGSLLEVSDDIAQGDEKVDTGKNKDKKIKRHLQAICSGRTKKLKDKRFECAGLYSRRQGKKVGKCKCNFDVWFANEFEGKSTESCPSSCWKMCETGDACEGTRQYFGICMPREKQVSKK